jgi:hypothetical protein
MSFRRMLTLLILARGIVSALSAWAQQKPFTREQVSSMIRAGLGDDSGVKLGKEPPCLLKAMLLSFV